MRRAQAAERRARAEGAEARARTEADKTTAVNDFLTRDLLSQAEPEKNAAVDHVTLLEVLDRAAANVGERFAGRPELEEAVRETIARTYVGLGAWEQAEAQRRAVSDSTRRRLGPDAPASLKAEGELGNILRHRGQTADAVRLLEANLKALESRLGPDHPGTHVGRNNLAVAYRAAGRTAEAVRLLEATVKAQEAKLGPVHPDTLTTRHNLAAAYWRTGRLDRSVPLFEETYRQQRAKLGADHPDTLRTLANLGVNYRDAGRPAEGARLMQEALDRASRHPEALELRPFIRAQLALAYEAAGQPDRAEPLLRTALEQARRQFGPADPRTAGAMAQLGMALLQQSKWSEAEPVLRDCLAAREQAQPDAWSTFNTR